MKKGVMLMASMHAYIVTSSHAVKVDPVSQVETVLEADAQGSISVKAGDILYFKHYKEEGFAPVNELIIHAGAQDVKLE